MVEMEEERLRMREHVMNEVRCKSHCSTSNFGQTSTDVIDNPISHMDSSCSGLLFFCQLLRILPNTGMQDMTRSRDCITRQACVCRDAHRLKLNSVPLPLATPHE